ASTPLSLPSFPTRRSSDLLIDCLTLWLSNLMLGAADIDAEIIRFEQALAAIEAPAVMVANEVGYGLVPDYPLGRRFRDLQGMLRSEEHTSELQSQSNLVCR